MARFKLQQQHFTAKVGYLAIYAMLVVYTFKFTFLYLKRMLIMDFLTVISPIVALTYPLDKMEGEAKGFQLWLKEFLFNALLQPLHYVLYYIFVSSSLSLAANNIIYAIAALMFISNAEKLLKRIFNFDKANSETITGSIGKYTAGAMVSKVTKLIKTPTKGGNAKGKGSKIGSSYDDFDYDQLPNDLRDDVKFEDFLPGNINGNVYGQVLQGEGQSTMPLQQQLNIQQDDPDQKIGFFGKYRKNLSKYSNEELGGLVFNDGDSRSLLEMIEQLSKSNTGNYSYSNESIDDLRNLLQYRIIANENGFEANGIREHYIDGDSRSNSALLNDITRFNALSLDSSYSDDERAQYASKAQEAYKLLERRMIENQYIQKQGGPEAILNPKKEDNLWQKFKEAPVTKGMANVGKTIIKPVWDSDKTRSYNAKRLIGHAGTAAKLAAGLSIGITLATVKTAIDAADGKITPVEAVTTAAGSVIAVTEVMSNNKVKKIYREAAMQGEEGKAIKDYSERWVNREDTIEFYNKEFPGKGKEVRERVAENYVSRGITDFNEQKKAIKFANLLQAERGMGRDEADKVAIATLQYRQDLVANSNYNVLFDPKKRQHSLDMKAEGHTGASSKASVKNLHKEFLENVRDFDRANG